MQSSSYAQILERIQAALEASRAVFARFTPGAIETEYKTGHDPVTEADRALDAVLRKELLREGEGWLSEESVDDPIRLQRSRVWVVDPLDGTREFVQGIPEFCVSIGFVENGRPVAGGIYNPATDETFLGSIDSGVTYNGKPAQPSQRTQSGGSSGSRQPQRGETRGVEGFGKFRLRDSAHGFGCLQAGAGLRGPGGCYFHTDSKERVGRGRRSRAGAELPVVLSALWRRPT